jgi:hypothetical protein
MLSRGGKAAGNLGGVLKIRRMLKIRENRFSGDPPISAL